MCVVHSDNVYLGGNANPLYELEGLVFSSIVTLNDVGRIGDLDNLLSQRAIDSPGQGAFSQATEGERCQGAEAEVLSRR